MERHLELASTGGISGMAALEAFQTGWASTNTDVSVDKLLEDNSDAAKMLEIMQEVYGKEKLDNMKPRELYKLYKDFVVSHKQ